MSEFLTHEEPFVIRGHHISTLSQLVAPMSSDPAQVAHRLREHSTWERGDLTAEAVNWDALVNPQNDRHEDYAVYAYDLIGETSAQADTFEEKYEATLTAFVSLPDDAAVMLTAKRLDGICNACTFQKHCQIPGESANDAKYLGIFEDVLGYARSKDSSLDVSAIRTNDEVLTTAKAVRRVLAHFAIAKLWQVNLYNDALRRHEKYGNVFGGPDVSELERYYDEYGHEIS
jgi:hypothetical protein